MDISSTNALGYDFNYLSIITDAYSKQIMGFCLHPYLTNDGCIEALQMALKNRLTSSLLIHHSDRGVQYCSFDYVDILRENKVSISMTSDGEGYENQIAERVNGILKIEFKLHQVFKSRTDAILVAHITNEPLIKKWRNSRKRNIKLEEQTAYHQHKEINLPL